MKITQRLRAAWNALRAPAAGRIAVRAYSAAQGGRLTGGWQSPNSSADAELIGSLQRMRGRARALVRDASYARNAKRIIVNNVIGWGVGMQAQVANQRDRLLDDVNSAIEEAWCEWSASDSCHTGGVLHFSDLERAAMGQLFEAGECFLRVHLSKFGASAVPLALELIEPERIAEEYVTAPDGSVRDVRMGVEVDGFYRPLAYWIRTRHPGDIRQSLTAVDRIERVPAEQIIHIYVCERWPQTRGEPWMASTMRRMNDMDGYSEAEIVAARGAASYMGFIKTPDNSPLAEAAPDPNDPTAQRTVQFEPGMMEQLPPGWDIEMNNPNRPNPNMDPFMRMMLREVAAGTGVSYESLSRDYSQSNYSSSRLAKLDDRDVWRVLQQFWLRKVRAPLHKLFVRQAVLARAIPAIAIADYIANTEKFEKVSFKPRGWTWIDPSKEIDANAKAVRDGFTTVSDVIAANGDGDDLEDKLRKRKRELELMHEAGLIFDTDPSIVDPSLPAKGAQAADQKPAKPSAEEPADGNDAEDATDTSTDSTDRSLRRVV